MIKNIITAMLLLCAIGAGAQNIEFKADINEMSPMSFEPKHGLSGFSLEMRNDSAFVYLPYMGRVYNPTDDDEFSFEQPYTELSVKPTKKNDGKKLNFKVRHDIVTFTFNVTLWDNNRIDILMQPSNAQSCSYSGQWTKIDKDSKK